jgi:hypothetical protein
MATQPFDNVHLLTASPSLLAPQVQVSSYAADLAGSEVMTSGTVRADAAWPAEAIANLHLLGKGVAWALAIESVAALSICGIWYLVHLWL